jgi:hypothetical protein
MASYQQWLHKFKYIQQSAKLVKSTAGSPRKRGADAKKCTSPAPQPFTFLLYREQLWIDCHAMSDLDSSAAFEVSAPHLFFNNRQSGL